MQATGTTMARYLPLFRARQADLLARGEVAGHPDVAATLGLALSRLAGQSPAAAALVRLLAFLAPEPVPLALLLAGDVRACAAAGRRPRSAGGSGHGGGCDHRAAPLLPDQPGGRRPGAGAPPGAGHHPRPAHGGDGCPVGAGGRRPGQSGRSRRRGHAPAWPVCAVLLPHARAVLDLTSSGIWYIAQYLGYSGSYPAARDLFRLIADAHAEDDAYGPEHLDTLAARNQLARWVGEAGDAAGARDEVAALLPISERVLGPEHPDTLTTRHILAFWAGEAGDAAGARDQFAVILPISERVLGPSTPTPWPPATNSPAGPGGRGMRPGPAISSPSCCPSASGSWVPSTPTP